MATINICTADHNQEPEQEKFVQELDLLRTWDGRELPAEMKARLVRVHERFADGGSRIRRIGIVALARRLLIDLWRCLEYGVVPEGAKVRPLAI